MSGRVVTGVVVTAALVVLTACSAAPIQPQPLAPSLPSLDTISREAEPGLYTKAFVAEALRRYDAEGRDATIAYYNAPESMDGEWYLFIIGEDAQVLAHAAIPDNVGLFVKEPLGIDANGYNFGAAMLAATKQGTWVSYVFENPARGGFPGDQARLGHQARRPHLRLRLVPGGTLRRPAGADPAFRARQSDRA